MNHQILVNAVGFYGLFLIMCGISAFLLIGPKAKTALLSGGFSGILSLLTAFLIFKNIPGGRGAGLFISLALFTVFVWRAAKTFFKLLEMITASREDLRGKGIAFLIISLMAVISLVVFMLQIVFNTDLDRTGVRL